MKTETGFYRIKGNTITFNNSGEETSFTLEDLRKMIVEDEIVFEDGALEAMRDEGISPEEALESGAGYRYEDGYIQGTDIMHAVDEALIDHL